MVEFAAGPDGLAGHGFSTDLDLPAFPLNFDPQELLAEVDAGSDPQLNLQEMLDLDIFGSPHAEEGLQNNLVPNAQNEAPLIGSKGGLASPSTGSHDSHQQATPGVYELFQLQHVAPSNTYNQQMQWPFEPQMLQQQVMQPVPAQVTSQGLYQQPYQQQQYQQQPPMQQQLPMQQQQQQQYLGSLQQPQGQFIYLPPASLQQQQQPMFLQQPQSNGYFLPSSMPQQAMFAAPNGSFISQQQLYMPQQQPADRPATTSPFLMPATFPSNPAGLQPADQILLSDGLQPIVVPPATANTGSGSLSSPMGLSFTGSGSGGSGQMAAAVAAANGAAGNARKGRSKAAVAPVAPGMEKPKGPSRRFRYV